jgi:thioredoxin-like negative regulator of GroEL
MAEPVATEAAKEIEVVKQLMEKDYEAEVLNSTLPVVIDFYSDPSAPCATLAPRYSAVAGKFEGKIRFLKTLRQGNEGLCERLSVTSSPTVVFFKGGKEFGERLTGDDIKRTALKGLVEALLK